MEKNENVDIAELIRTGGVYRDVEGSTPEEVYKNLCSGLMKFSPSIESKSVYKALCDRERIMSTAVGNGIALPHARPPLAKELSDQQIGIAYLKTPLDMNAPDGRSVYVMFVLLTHNSQVHLQILSSLVELFKKTEFKNLLEAKADKTELLEAIKKLA